MFPGMYPRLFVEKVNAAGRRKNRNRQKVIVPKTGSVLQEGPVLDGRARVLVCIDRSVSFQF